MVDLPPTLAFWARGLVRPCLACEQHGMQSRSDQAVSMKFLNTHVTQNAEWCKITVPVLRTGLSRSPVNAYTAMYTGVVPQPGC